MKKEKKVWALTLLAFWSLSPNLINAQQRDSLTTKTLDEVVITATKFPKSESETGKVVTVITEEQLLRSGGRDLTQVLNDQVGLVINGSGSNPGKDKSVFLRGAKGAYTLILIDGVPVQDPSLFGGAFDLRLIPVDQIERIEILKGSESTLYGSDAIAGVINLITKKKGDRPFGGFANATYGSYNTLKTNAGIQGSTQYVDYNASYTRFSSDGISEAEDKENAGFDKDAFTQQGTQVSIGIKPVKGLTITPFFRYNTFDADFDAGAFTDAPYTSTSEVINAGLQATYRLKRGTINFQGASDRTDRKYDYTDYVLSYKGKFEHVEAFTQYDLNDHLQILGGLNYQVQKMDDATSDDDLSFTITSPYVSLFLHNLNGISAEAGIRYISHEQFGDIATFNFNPSYRINNSIKLFVNGSTGYKTPVLSQLYGQWGANPDLKPERSQHLEGGVQFLSTNGKAEVRATYFDRRTKDVIAYTSQYVNLDKQHDHGIEIETSVVATEEIKVTAFYTFVTGDVTTKTFVGTDTTYNNLLRVPKNTFGVNIGYTLSPEIYFSLNLKSFGDRKDIFFNPDYTTGTTTLDDYQLLDFYGEYRFKKKAPGMKIFVDAKNLLDQNYTEVYGYGTMGFNVTGGVSLTF